MRYLIAASCVLAGMLLGCEKKKPVIEEPVPALRPGVAEPAPSPSTPAAMAEPPVRRIPVPGIEPARPLDTLLPPPMPEPQPPVAQPPVAQPPVAGYRTYVVRSGDKGFMSIARNVLGDERRWREIAQLNPGVDTRKLRIGQQIKIPAK